MSGFNVREDGKFVELYGEYLQDESEWVAAQKGVDLIREYFPSIDFYTSVLGGGRVVVSAGCKGLVSKVGAPLFYLDTRGGVGFRLRSDDNKVQRLFENEFGKSWDDLRAIQLEIKNFQETKNKFEQLLKRTRSLVDSEEYINKRVSGNAHVPDLYEMSEVYEELDREFREEVIKSTESSQEERLARLAKAEKKPQPKVVSAIVYNRNPDVVAEVLVRADGRCEECRSEAPFMRKSDGTPYLEVHHKIRLADGGDDTVENAQALCPNCHRKAHYG